MVNKLRLRIEALKWALWLKLQAVRQGAGKLLVAEGGVETLEWLFMSGLIVAFGAIAIAYFGGDGGNKLKETMVNIIDAFMQRIQEATMGG
jgi:hypothetical protein